MLNFLQWNKQHSNLILTSKSWSVIGWRKPQQAKFQKMLGLSRPTFIKNAKIIIIKDGRSKGQILIKDV